MAPQEKMPESAPGRDNPAFEGDVTLRTHPDINSDKNQESQQKNCLEPMDFDDILPYIGEFGRYQKILFLLMIPFAFFVAFVYFTQIFITLVPEEHWCWVPELANLTKEQRIKLAIPRSKDGVSPDQCRMYAVDFTALLASGVEEADNSWPVTESCPHGWEFSYDEIPYVTAATEMEWVCGGAALPGAAQAIFFAGAVAGGLLLGWLADRKGRVAALLVANILGLIGGAATAGANSFWTFCLCRFLVGMAFDNTFTMMYILVLEYVGPKWRTFVANMSIALFFTAATCILPWLAWFIADWRALCLATSLPLALALLSPWLLPESARWLVSQGRIDEAVEICKKFARINQMTVDPQIYSNFSESCYAVKKEEEKSNKNYSVLDLFRTPRLRRITILLIIIWMAISLVFDGHVRNVGSLGYNVFVTFTIASATELPADTLLTLTLDRWGRRGLAFGTMAMSGIFSVLAVFAGGSTGTAVLAIIGRFAINISYNIGLQYAAELLPTVVRAQGVALIHIMGYVASVLAPFIVYLGSVSPALPLLILGLLGIIGGILALFLPETLGHDLPQTLEDGEEFGRDQKMWDFPCCQKRQNDVEMKENVGKFRRSTPGSFRASVRGEIRSSIIHRRSVRSAAITTPTQAV